MPWRDRLIELLERNSIAVWAVGELPSEVSEDTVASVIVRPEGRDETNALVCSVRVLGNPLYGGFDPDAGLEDASTAVWKVLWRNAVDVQVGGAENYEVSGPVAAPGAKGRETFSVPVWTSQVLFATDPCRPGLRG